MKVSCVGLTLDNFTHWMGTEPLNPDFMLDWMDSTRILLKFYRRNVDVKNPNRRYVFSRDNCPGDYEPDWQPRQVYNIIITSFPFYEMEFTTESMPTEYKCGKPDCGFQTPRKDKLDKHRESCRNFSLITSKQRVYGGIHNPLEPVFKFACYDIETVEKESEYAEATLELLSIGVAANVEGLQSKYFVRKSSSPEHGQAMVDEFMDYLFELSELYDNYLPESLYDEYNELIETADFFNGTRNGPAKQAANLKKHQIKEQLMFSVYGFNSRKFDMKVLVGYILVYAEERDLEIKLLKKGSSYFQLDIETIAFKGNYSIRINLTLQIFYHFRHLVDSKSISSSGTLEN